jgi:sigma-E factor negative regulatory protein RseC
MSQKIEHTGIVTHIDGTKIQVQIVQLSACSSCHAKGACSASDMDEKLIDAETTDTTLKIGDQVQLTGESSMGLFAVLIAFIIPFLLILFSLFILRSYTSNEALSGTIALGVLVPYFIILSLFNKKLKNKLKFTVERI